MPDVYNDIGRVHGFHAADRTRVEDFANRVSTTLTNSQRQVSSESFEMPDYLEFEEKDLDTSADLYEAYVNKYQAMREMAYDSMNNGINVLQPNPSDPYSVEQAKLFQRMYADVKDAAMRLRVSKDNADFQREQRLKDGIYGPQNPIRNGQGGTMLVTDIRLANLKDAKAAVESFNKQDMNAYDDAQLLGLQQQRETLRKELITRAIQEQDGPSKDALYLLADSLDKPYSDKEALDKQRFNERKQTEAERKAKAAEEIKDKQLGIAQQRADDAEEKTRQGWARIKLSRDKFENSKQTEVGSILFDQLAEIRNGETTNDYVGSMFNQKPFNGNKNILLDDVVYNPDSGMYEVTLLKKQEDDDPVKEIRNLTEYELVKAFGTKSEESGYIARAKEVGALAKKEDGSYEFNFGVSNEFDLNSTADETGGFGASFNTQPTQSSGGFGAQFNN